MYPSCRLAMSERQEEELGGSLTVHGLPRSHWHCTLGNFGWDGVKPVALRQTLADFVAKVKEGQAPHLLLSGDPGIGKSHLGVGVYRAAVEHWGTQLATWVSVPDFCDAVKRAYDGGVDPFRDFELARRLVVLDDLFGRELSTHEATAIIFRMINVAYQNGAALLITMNQNPQALGGKLPAHEVSRLLANAQVVLMAAAADYRRRKV